VNVFSSGKLLVRGSFYFTHASKYTIVVRVCVCVCVCVRVCV